MRSYLKDISNLKESVTQKTQLTTEINLMSSKGTDEECLMYSKRGNIEIIINVKSDEATENFLTSFQISNWLKNNSKRKQFQL